MENLKEGDIVTLDFNSDVSNTLEIHKIVDNHAYLNHPLSPDIFIKKELSTLNKVSPNVKDSTERSLDFVKTNKEYLDYNNKLDLESLCISFIVNRKLTPKQKKILSDLSGKIAEIKFNGNVKDAMRFITSNEVLLDGFNKMWYNNFSNLFSGKQTITSKKQLSAIFNIAGFVCAELSIPSAKKLV